MLNGVRNKLASWLSVEVKSNRVLGLDGPLRDLLLFGMPGNAASPSGAMSLYTESSAVSIPVIYIGDAFASINPILKKDDKVIRTHPLLSLLRRPSPRFTKNLFFQSLGKNYLIANETELVAIGNVNRPPLELLPINPANVNPVEGGNGIIMSHHVSGNTLPGSYVIQTGKNTGRYFDGQFKEIKQIRGYSTLNNSMLRGQSVLVSASAEVRHHIEGNKHNISLLTNGGRVSLVFHFKDSQGPDEHEENKKRVNNQFGGSTKAGTIGVTSGGDLDIQELGTNNKDMDFAQLHKLAKQAVAQAYKFPLPLLTIEASTLNNYETSKLALFDDAALPLADCIFDGLQDFLFPRFQLDHEAYRLTFDEEDITALKSRRNDQISKRISENIESLNEYRELRGRDPKPGGDEIRVPVNLVPISSDPFGEDDPAKNTE